MRHGSIELDWADGTYSFRLGLGEIRELEDKANRGIFQIADDLDPTIRAARAHVILETIRLGLIGGGMTPVDALAKVRRYVDERPLTENLLVAYAIVMAGVARIHGLPEKEADSDTPGKPTAAGAPTSPPSTEQAQ